jgi:arylsulfatase A-like enzyme
MITNIDENMGLMMQKLDEWKLADNTLLIFMTDNGSSGGWEVYNAGMKGHKGSANEGGSRVPLFMRLPGKIKPSVDVDRLARHHDIFPTLAEFAGATIPKTIELDGRSLVPLINNPKAEWADRYTFFHIGRWGKKGGMLKKPEHKITDPDKAKYKDFAVRNEKWRYVGVWSRTPKLPAALYDIENDPGEKENDIEQHPEVARNMLIAYDKWWDEVRPLMINKDASLNTGKPFPEQFRKQKQETGIPDWVSPQL